VHPAPEIWIGVNHVFFADPARHGVTTTTWGETTMIRYTFWLLTTTLWIIALADALRSGGTLGRKIVSVALIVAFPVIGSLVYLFMLRDWAQGRA
jgi:hypothetical protein